MEPIRPIEPRVDVEPIRPALLPRDVREERKREREERRRRRREAEAAPRDGDEPRLDVRA